MRNKVYFVFLLHIGCFVNSPGKLDKNGKLDKKGKHIEDEDNKDNESNESEELKSFSFPTLDTSTYPIEIVHDICRQREKALFVAEGQVKELQSKTDECLNERDSFSQELSKLNRRIQKLEEENALLICGANPAVLKLEENFRIMEKEKDDNFNCMLREKDTRISYLEKNQSSRLDKNVTICLKASCVIVAGCFAWQFFLRDFLFYHFPKLDKGKIERMKREEARLAALRARA